MKSKTYRFYGVFVSSAGYQPDTTRPHPAAPRHPNPDWAYFIGFLPGRSPRPRPPPPSDACRRPRSPLVPLRATRSDAAVSHNGITKGTTRVQSLARRAALFLVGYLRKVREHRERREHFGECELWSATWCSRSLREPVPGAGSPGTRRVIDGRRMCKRSNASPLPRAREGVPGVPGG